MRRCLTCVGPHPRHVLRGTTGVVRQGGELAREKEGATNETSFEVERVRR
jgi:hypothetical protein